MKLYLFLPTELSTLTAGYNVFVKNPLFSPQITKLEQLNLTALGEKKAVQSGS